MDTWTSVSASDRHDYVDTVAQEAWPGLGRCLSHLEHYNKQIMKKALKLFPRCPGPGQSPGRHSKRSKETSATAACSIRTLIP